MKKIKSFSVTHISMTILVISIFLISGFVSCGKTDNWCVGKWSGQLNTRMHEKFVIRIHDDQTCSVKAEWFWGGVRSSDFEAEWEPISEDVIKIYDYDGHSEHWHNSFNGINERRISRWSMYLRKDGAFSHSASNLDNPDGYLKKQK